MRRRLVSLALGLLLGLSAVAAAAASVGVVVGDAAGNPLTGAVVMLEPVSGVLPVKPLAGVQIAQHDLQFDPQVSVVTVGTPVAFPNRDTVRHHVYSFSPAKSFQLKLYAGAAHAPVVFDKPGIAVLGCNIHDQMVAWVVVVDTPLWARSGGGGRARIEDVPPGTYQLRVWHAGLDENQPPQSSDLVVGAADVEQRVKLAHVGAAK